MELLELANYSMLTFTSVLCVANPVRAAATFGRVSGGWDAARRGRVARRSVLLAGGVLLATAWTASGIVYAANIHTGGLRVGAGLLLIALMLSDTVRIGSAAAQPATASGPVETLPPAAVDDESAVVRSTAMRLANAGTLATVALYSGEWFELWRRGVAMAAVIATAVIAYGLLRIGDRVRAELSDTGLVWVTIAMNLVTLAWVADFTAIGVRDLLPLILTTPPAR